MDETLQEFENELTRLPPRRPSARLWQELELELGRATTARDVRVYRTATNLASWKWLGWRTAGIAATLVLLAAFCLVKFDRPVAADQSQAPRLESSAMSGTAAQDRAVGTPDRYRPVAASNVLYDLKDEGTVYVDGDVPARRLRYRFLDTYTWKNSQGTASIKWSVPRDEIRVVPIAMN